MNFNAKIEYPTKMVLNLTTFGTSGRGVAILRAAMERLAIKSVMRVKEKLSGPVLKVRSGRLRGSIRHQLKGTGTSITVIIFSRGVPYAAIHEYGGRTKAHLIEAKNAKVLAFEVGGKTVFAKRVMHPGSVIPERSYLRSTLHELKATIKQELVRSYSIVLAREGRV